MTLALLADPIQIEELLGAAAPPSINIIHIESPQTVKGAEHYLDLLFDNSIERVEQWKAIPGASVILNAVETVPADLIRINGWPGFMRSGIIEAAGPPNKQEKVNQLFSLMGKKLEWVPNLPGFISPRIISMIINEAYFTAEEGVSDEVAIDTAMKLGTNYPYGPFEWASLIGHKRIYSLLSELEKEDSRYHPSKLLMERANQS